MWPYFQVECGFPVVCFSCVLPRYHLGTLSVSGWSRKVCLIIYYTLLGFILHFVNTRKYFHATQTLSWLYGSIFDLILKRLKPDQCPRPVKTFLTLFVLAWVLIYMCLLQIWRNCANYLKINGLVLSKFKMFVQGIGSNNGLKISISCFTMKTFIKDIVTSPRQTFSNHTLNQSIKNLFLKIS